MTTSDQIAQLLRDAIVAGEFEDGAELNQVALAKHFGISRVPLREALRQLQAEGLVSAKAHQRTVVTTLSLDRVVEILEIRALLEVHLLEQTISLYTPADVERLEQLCKEMNAITDHQVWLKTNREFHAALCQPSGAVFTIDLIDQLSARVARYLHLLSSTGVERNREANDEHWAIVQAIKSRNKRAARRELKAHIDHTKERMIELLRARRDTEAAAEG